MYGNTINGVPSSGNMHMPMRLIMLGWLNRLAVLHSLRNSSVFSVEASEIKTQVNLLFS